MYKKEIVLCKASTQGSDKLFDLRAEKKDWSDFFRMNPWSVLISQVNSISQKINVFSDFNISTMEVTGRFCYDLPPQWRIS
jgi:hypothetical protein